MGIRIKKTKKFGPLNINFSKSGIGFSLGNKFIRRSKLANGQTKTTFTIPGTGISYIFGKKKKK